MYKYCYPVIGLAFIFFHAMSSSAFLEGLYRKDIFHNHFQMFETHQHQHVILSKSSMDYPRKSFNDLSLASRPNTLMFKFVLRFRKEVKLSSMLAL